MKVVGIIGRVYYNRDNQDIIQIYDKVRLALSNYSDVVSIGILPTNNNCYSGLESGNDYIDDIDRSKLDKVLEMCDGFIIPGGTNWYKFDEYVIEYALKKDKPLLGICAGFQCICSMFAVNRNKFDMTDRLSDNNHYGDSSKYIHDVTIVNGTLLKDIINKNKLSVNSVHHDYISCDMDDIVISARSFDNIVEAVEVADKKFFLGVQWHPEYLMDSDSIKIFDRFVKCLKKSR